MLMKMMPIERERQRWMECEFLTLTSITQVVFLCIIMGGVNGFSVIYIYTNVYLCFVDKLITFGICVREGRSAIKGQKPTRFDLGGRDGFSMVAWHI